tara:strand:- start:149 stop:604 length:456 start_codon:yes stop_codon:yes gene_type:complete
MTRNEWTRVCGARLQVHGITNFSPLEIADVGRQSSGVSLSSPPLGLLSNALKLVDVLQWLRNEGEVASVLVNSWWRSPEYNEAIGGVANSMHLTLGASDIVKVGWTPRQVADLLESSPYKEQLGIGRYKTFTHVDVRGMIGRPAPARWGTN